jgi:RNA polymerase sigma factor (sigma-70 family)
VSAVAAVEAQADVGSPEAYAARLYERHSQAIFRLCLKHLRRREDADDAVQTTFVYALLSLRRGVVPRMELPWLLTIARNVCSTRRRSGTRRGTYESPHDLDAIQDKLATPDRSDVASTEDFLIALRAIPETQRKALLLREWRGFSYDEIGSELGLSQAATEALLFRARQNVAQRLEGRISVKTLNGLPFLTFVRNLFQTGTAKLVAVAVGTTLTIASVPAADVGSKHVAKPPARLGSTPSAERQTPRATKRSPAKPQPEATHRRAGVAPIHSEPAIGDTAVQTPTGDAAITAVSPSPTVHADTPQPSTTTPTVEVPTTDVGAILPLPVTPSAPSLPLPTPSIVAPAPPVVTVPDVSLPDLHLPQGP